MPPPSRTPTPPRAARILSLCLLAPTLLYARPGGGGSFHSGGSGGHGFSAGVHGHAGIGHGGPLGLGDSAVSGRQILFFIGLLAAYLLFRLLAGWVFRAGARALGVRAGAAPGRPGPQFPQGVPPAPGLQGLHSLRQQDPGLTEEGITRRALRMAEILREAWCAGDMRPARSFVSDGVFCRFTTQLAMMRARGERNAMGDARIVAIASVGAELAPPLEVLHLRVDGQARDCTVPLDASAEQVARALHAVPVAPYTEIWSLVRRQGVQTRSGAAPVGQACPSCGAPLGNGEVIQCQYCHALVNSGEYDWVLAKITQPAVWHPVAAERIPGFAALRGADPGLAAAALEDRASFLFWKWIEACAQGSPAPMRKCAIAGFLAAMPAAPALLDVAVGGVDLLACGPAGEHRGMDAVTVKVTWSGASGPGAESLPRVQLIAMARQAGVMSSPASSALLCPECGAALGASDSDRCDHCHAQVATGAHAWVLAGVVAG